MILYIAPANMSSRHAPASRIAGMSSENEPIGNGKTRIDFRIKLLLVGALILILLVSWRLLMPSQPLAIKNMNTSSFGIYLDQKAMTHERSVCDMLGNMPSIGADAQLELPNNSGKLTLQIPPGYFARARWIPELEVAVGTISALDWNEYQKFDQYKAEMLIIAACRAVYWSRSGKMYALDQLLPEERFGPKRLTAVVDILDSRGEVLVAGPMPLAETVQIPEIKLDPEALKSVGLTAGELFGPPAAYAIELRKK